MDHKTQRPLNINPFSIRLPLPALISISHRLSGIFIFLGIPFLLLGLQRSLESQHSFYILQRLLMHPVISMVAWLFLAALCLHLLAGCRHLLMDCQIGDSLKGGRLGAWIVVIVFCITMIFFSAYFKGMV